MIMNKHQILDRVRLKITWSGVRWEYTVFLVFFALLLGCELISYPSPPPPIPADTPVSELRKMVVDLSLEESVRFDAAERLGEMGPAAASAVPELTQALSLPSHDVRAEAAWALGQIGPEAAPAIPVLIERLAPGNDRKVRGEAAWALGRIGPPNSSAVPRLVQNLTDKDWYVRGSAAWAIARITGNHFPDADGDGRGFSGTGTPEKELLIVIAAREWWQKEGQYQDWGN